MTSGPPENEHETHEAIQADFSDYYDRTLPPTRAQEVEAHLSACERCRAEYARFSEAVGALSGLHKMSAPQHFEEQVAQTIHRRSAGKFFGRRAFGDRIPYEAIAILAIVLAVALALLIRFSATGTVHEVLRRGPEAPAPAPGAREVAPRP